METTVYVATLATSNFEFEAMDATSDAALELLEGAWLRHFEQCGRPADMLSFDSVLDGCDEQRLPGYAYQVRERRVGQAWLDGARL